MIFRSIGDAAASRWSGTGEGWVNSGDGWVSQRLLLKADAVNFSLSITDLEPGTELDLAYLNHFEANYCISGTGHVTDVAKGRTYSLKPGDIYVVDQHDHHILRAETELRLVCVFWPALTGTEKHDAKGGYPLSE
jgi:L-ectoine synthase